MNNVANLPIIRKINISVRPVLEKLQLLAPMAALLLILRVYVAWQFLSAALTKITVEAWTLFVFPSGIEIRDATYVLFESEYNVPLLDPELAAELGTYVELIIPYFLIAGFAGRINALVLFGFNLVAVISYWGMPLAGKLDHLFWGLILFAVIAYGPGKLSLDHLVARWLGDGKVQD